MLRGLQASVARRSCSGRVALWSPSGAMSPRLQNLGVQVVGWHGGGIVIGLNVAHVAMSAPVWPSAPMWPSAPVSPSVLVSCELLDTIEQPYRIPTNAPPSTVVIAHAVRIIVLPSCGIPRHAPAAWCAPRPM
jgi:hypothetical protein